jgi:nuclear GTP-binding protein
MAGTFGIGPDHNASRPRVTLKGSTFGDRIACNLAMAGSINKPKSESPLANKQQTSYPTSWLKCDPLCTEPKSKRTPVRLRHRIEKASKAKQRKARKEAKKNPQWKSKLKKDPGIPNLFPYKERLLQKIEDERIRKREETLRRREAMRTARGENVGAEGRDDDETGMEGLEEDADGLEVMEEDEDMEVNDDEDDGANPMAALLASARRAAEEYDKTLQSGGEDEDEDSVDTGSEDGISKTVPVPEGATSRKAYDKVFKDVVEQADVVLYVLDARDPDGTRSRDLERSVMASASGGKRLILVLNKIDLVPSKVLTGWLVHLRRYFPTLPLRAAGAAPNAQTFNHGELTVQNTSAALFRALKSFAASRNLKRAVSVGVIGYPNVGKSSVINALMARLSGSKGQRTACPAGAEAGVTTAIRAVKVDNKLTLLDSPGIVFPSTSSATLMPGAPALKNRIETHAHLVLLNAVPPKQIDDPVPAVTLLLRRLSTSPKLMERLTSVYDLPPLLTNSVSGDTTTDFLVQVARKRGRLGKGGVPHLTAAAMTVVTDWRDGRIQGWTEPPVLAIAPDSSMANDGARPAPETGRKGAADDVIAPDQKEIVTEWAKEFSLEGLWGNETPEEMQE